MHAIASERTPRSLRNEALGIRPTRSEHTVTLRLAEFDQVMATVGCVTNLDVAQFLNLGEGTVSRLRAGVSQPGVAVLVAFAKKFPKVPPRRVFDFGDDELESAA
jgi:hypothetical protein